MAAYVSLKTYDSAKNWIDFFKSLSRLIPLLTPIQPIDLSNRAFDSDEEEFCINFLSVPVWILHF